MVLCANKQACGAEPAAMLPNVILLPKDILNTNIEKSYKTIVRNFLYLLYDK